MNTPSSETVLQELKATCVGLFVAVTVALLVIAGYIGVQAIANSFETEPAAVVLGFMTSILVLMTCWALGTEILDNLEENGD